VRFVDPAGKYPSRPRWTHRRGPQAPNPDDASSFRAALYRLFSQPMREGRCFGGLHSPLKRLVQFSRKPLSCVGAISASRSG
jgi:hypothetical protein